MDQIKERDGHTGHTLPTPNLDGHFIFAWFFLFFFPKGVYTRGAAEPSRDSHHPHLLPEEEVAGDH